MFLSNNCYHFFARVVVSCTCLLAISACTPALNWREVRFESGDGITLRANLPCKPDIASRKQQLGDIQVELSMMGCLVNDATFTMSRIPLSDPLSATQVLMAWQASAAVNIKATPNTPTPTIVKVSGASAWPSATRATFAGANTQAQIMWFAKQTAMGLTLYQAAVYGKQLDDDTSATFFESLQLL